MYQLIIIIFIYTQYYVFKTCQIKKLRLPIKGPSSVYHTLHGQIDSTESLQELEENRWKNHYP